MIEFQDIKKSFKTDFWSQKTEVLKGVNFSIGEGEIIGFLGANGAGKTTLIKILMDFIPKDSGKINFSESLWKKGKNKFQDIGFIPERPYFYPYLTGREFIYYMGKINRISQKLIESRMKSWSIKLKIEDALERKIRAYSKGMLQRLGVVSCLINDPKLLIMDEPLSGLDPVGRKEIKDILRELGREGKTVFFSSHIVNDVEEVCENVVILEQGKIFYDGSIEKLIKENLKSHFFIKTDLPKDEILGTELLNDSWEREERLLTVNAAGKDSLIKEIVEKGYRIREVGRHRPSLEEIVYKVK